MNTEKQNHARTLYMSGSKTQKEIAEAVGVTERTIYNWIKQFAWDKLKQAAFQAPAIIADNLCSQIVELQTEIGGREPGKRFPTLQEAETTRKLIGCLEKIKNTTSLAQNLQMMESFTRYARTKNPEVAKTIHRCGEDYLEARAINGFKPYEMEYFPYNISPFSFFSDNNETESTTHQPTTPLQTSATGLQHENFSEPENAILSGTQPIDLKAIDDKINTETDRKKPEIQGENLDTPDPRSPFPIQLPDTQNEFNLAVEAIDKKDTSDISSPDQAISEVADSDSPNQDSEEVPFTFTYDYFITLPPHRRPSPFRDGNIIWINHQDDIESNLQHIKMGDIIRYYPDMDPNSNRKRA